MLEDLGHEVVGGQNSGEQALTDPRPVGQPVPDLIITDYSMPDDRRELGPFERRAGCGPDISHPDCDRESELPAWHRIDICRAAEQALSRDTIIGRNSTGPGCRGFQAPLNPCGLETPTSGSWPDGQAVEGRPVTSAGTIPGPHACLCNHQHRELTSMAHRACPSPKSRNNTHDVRQFTFEKPAGFEFTAGAGGGGGH